MLSSDHELTLLTVDEAAVLLRTTPRAVYAMAERRGIGGVVRIGRRLLFSRPGLLDWLARCHVPSAEE